MAGRRSACAPPPAMRTCRTRVGRSPRERRTRGASRTRATCLPRRRRASITVSPSSPGATQGDGSLTQTVSVAADQRQIDAGQATFDLSGWLGGHGSENDRAALIATFLDSVGGALGSRQIGPVTNADRGDVTAFLPRRRIGQVPAGTRAIRLD